MPNSADDIEVTEKAREDEREGKSPSTQAGEFVREEMHHIREGKHGAQSPEQATAIGLSKARRAGVKLPVPARSKMSAQTRKQAIRELRNARGARNYKTSRTRSRATTRALEREGSAAASHASLASHERAVARCRGPQARRQAGRKAARTRAKRRRAA